MPHPTLRLRVAGTGDPLDVAPARLIIAGYAGRDAAAVKAHIAELAAIGVPEPPRVPDFYDLDPGLLTTAPAITVAGRATSGEVEPVLIRAGGRYYLAVGSDHTDRDLERDDIAAAKAACGKPIGTDVIALPADLGAFDWDAVAVTSEVDGRAYQDGALAALRTPADLLARLADALGPIGGDLALFGGTLPLLDGGFTPGTTWRMRLAAPGGAELTRAYDTIIEGRGA